MEIYKLIRLSYSWYKSEPIFTLNASHRNEHLMKYWINVSPHRSNCGQHTIQSNCAGKPAIELFSF